MHSFRKKLAFLAERAKFLNVETPLEHFLIEIIQFQSESFREKRGFFPEPTPLRDRMAARQPQRLAGAADVARKGVQTATAALWTATMRRLPLPRQQGSFKG